MGKSRSKKGSKALDAFIRRARNEYRREKDESKLVEILLRVDSLQRERHKLFGSFLPHPNGHVYYYAVEEEKFYRYMPRLSSELLV